MVLRTQMCQQNPLVLWESIATSPEVRMSFNTIIKARHPSCLYSVRLSVCLVSRTWADALVFFTALSGVVWCQLAYSFRIG